MTEKEAKKLEVSRMWDRDAGWVCVYCQRETNTFHIATGHDHTDDSIHWCVCRKENND